MHGAARDQLIRDHLPLVHRVSERLRASWRDGGLEIDDLVGSGAVGLVKAAERFDPTKGASFKTYAEIVIEGAIRDGVGRGSCWFGRRAVGRVAVVHIEDLSPDGREGWLGQAHDSEVWLPALWNGRPLFQPPNDGELDLRSILADQILHLPERERRVVQLCFYEGKKLTHAAQEMKIRLPLASRLRKRALRHLHQAINKDGSQPQAVDRKGETGSGDPEGSGPAPSARAQGAAKPSPKHETEAGARVAA